MSDKSCFNDFYPNSQDADRDACYETRRQMRVIETDRERATGRQRNHFYTTAENKQGQRTPNVREMTLDGVYNVTIESLDRASLFAVYFFFVVQRESRECCWLTVTVGVTLLVTVTRLQSLFVLAHVYM